MIDKVKKLYFSEKKSILRISKELGISNYSVTSYLKETKLPLRNRSQALRALYKTAAPQSCLTEINQEILVGLGIGIYLGEGSKTTKHTVKVANTNSKILILFRKFMSENYGVTSEKVKYWLHVYNDLDREKCRLVWAQSLEIEKSRIQITSVVRRGKGSYKNKVYFGTMSLEINDSGIREALFSDIEKVLKT